MALPKTKDTSKNQTAPDDQATPLLAQYLAIKSQHADCLLFFRLGDFYEMFFEDAKAAASAIDLTLTRRGQFQGEDVPMCGIPVHAYETYLARLIRKGFRVAICEQTEDPATARKRGGGKAIVNREVVRIVTPGTVTEESLLDARAANNLACVTMAGGQIALAWMDLTSAAPCVASMEDWAALGAALARVAPTEIVTSDRVVAHNKDADVFFPWRAALTTRPDAQFDQSNAERRLLRTWSVSALDAIGDFSRAEIAALGALIDYAALTQKSDLSHIARPRREAANACMAIDPATRRNLEITQNLSGDRRGSLLHALDRTVTGAGARLLAARLNAPLTDPASIAARHDAIALFLDRTGLRDTTRDMLKRVPDLERALARLSLGRGGPRDLAAVRDAMRGAGTIRSALLAVPPAALPDALRNAAAHMDDPDGLADTLTAALAPDVPLLARDGGFIARGYAAHLDELIELRDDSRRTIAVLQQTYASASGVATLKIKHNQIIGYYIEVSPGQAERLLAKPDTFIHRQTLATAARFTTTELADLDRRIAEAGDKTLSVELQIFTALTEQIVARLSALRQTAEALAATDLAAALATLALEQNHVRPIVDDSLTFTIRAGRHPVVEQALKASAASFVANDCSLVDPERLWLLTGPNMAGKSTFLRQNALIALMAQAGCYVPAAAAHIGVADRLFSRVGAADDLAQGRSTFMVEMVETAAILNQSGPRALVILDEIGRGTATYDGMAIAWATIEHLHEVNRCRGLFATHYHELTALTERLSSLHCATMKIREWQNGIVFLHEVVRGTADRSYGVHVARMAGMPDSVVLRAEEILSTIEDTTGENRARTAASTKAKMAALPLFDAAPPPPPVACAISAELMSLLRAIEPDDLTPKQAQDLIYQITALAKY